MEAKEGRLQQLFEGEKQFVIPIYQRDYSWEEGECAQLLSDIIRVGQTELEGYTHFVGSIVSIGGHDPNPLGTTTHVVIDGQQRLTTLSLLTLAIIHGGHDDERLGITAKRLGSRYIYNAEMDQNSDSYAKLRLNADDDETYRRIIYEKPFTEADNNRVRANYEYFSTAVTSEKAVDAVRGLAKVMLVSIILDRAKDNPQMIFESLNSTGKRLSQTDLIRNFVLMDLAPAEQTRLFETYWQPLVRRFGLIAEAKLDSFMRAYLTRQTGSVPLITAIYDGFKGWTNRPDYRFPSFASHREELLADIARSAEQYGKLVFGNEPDARLKRVFDSLQAWKMDVAHPLLMRMYELYDAGIWTAEVLAAAVEAIESYVVRRSICGMPSNSVGASFVSTLKYLDGPDPASDTVQAVLLSLAGRAELPRDRDVKSALATQNLYSKKGVSEILTRLEQSYHPQEVVLDSSLSIEHVMPQQIDQRWADYLGPDAVRIHDAQLHVLGNLTLTGYNSEFKNLPFDTKRDRREGGFANSPLSLNQWIGQQERWGEAQIQQRGAVLAEKICSELWVLPIAGTSTVTVVKDEDPDAGKTWGGLISLDDYVNLTERNRARYLDFEARVRALEPDLTIEYFRSGISIKLGLQVMSVSDQRTGPMVFFDSLRVGEFQDPEGRCSYNKFGVPRLRLNEGTKMDYVEEIARQAVAAHLGTQ